MQIITMVHITEFKKQFVKMNVSTSVQSIKLPRILDSFINCLATFGKLPTN